jgi:type IV pilus assembly protein PilB
LIGETRSKETAEIAINAALTGHLVFTTLHTNSAIESIPRLTSMEIKPYMLAPSLNLIIAQRLVRKICSHCGTRREADY